MIYFNVRALIIRKTTRGEEILVQRRVRLDEKRTPIELPGGRVEKYELLIEGLKREIKEETGLELDSIIDPINRIETKSAEGFIVECMKPYAVYQTIEGPVNSLGVYFKCTASGELLEEGDFTDNIRWVTLE
ncbi:NUDIX hydrolase [Chengkuizengella axinellae]|uniref:NUDIX domain-containing protein n=1 Tax=Chengkuizengella axinellae TaxID=3064388 RepID=A0ABT9J534_9BACL|nr:NUDIX domain-containing protein [Chengkuizengella sp. 2205SS18-9]MDP5276712.1 NUDIX domain-containing protein [Chengkuizengella sp. 2205SS18-9]